MTLKKTYFIVLRQITLSLFFMLIGAMFSHATTSKLLVNPQAIAFAYPLKDIVIDGQLEDWPKDLEKHPLLLAKKYGDKVGDIQAYFQVGYLKEENAIAFAISYLNEEELVSKDKKWTEQESYSFLIDEQHLIQGSGVLRYSFNTILKESSNPEISWDPSVKAYYDWNKLTVKQLRLGNRVNIEFKYRLQRAISPGMAIGIGHIVVDLFKQGALPTYYTWSGHPFMDRTARQLGTVFLLEDSSGLSQLSGQVALDTAHAISKKMPKSLLLKDSNNDQSWSKIRVDIAGRFTATLPQGSYRFVLDSDVIEQPEGFTRVQLSSPTTEIQLSPDRPQHLTLPLKITPPPDLLPQEGLLKNGYSQNDEMIIDQFVEAYQKYYDIPGVSLTIFEGGAVVYSKAFGYQNQYTKVPVEPNTVFEGASMTKPMFGFAVMRLVEKGMIDLDTPMYQYTTPPEDVKDNPWVKLITARMVLSHTTGFPNWAKNAPDGTLYFKFRPGTGVSYSGEGFTYLRRAVEDITQQPITDILKKEVLEPLDLKGIYFKNTPGLEKITANGHLFNLPRLKAIPERAEMASSVHASSQSYANFLLAVANRKGLKPETYESFISHSTLRHQHKEQDQLCKHYYGLGIDLRESPFFGLSYGHSGSNGDFKCTSTIYENTKNGFVVMTNSNTGFMLQLHLHNLLNIGKEQIDP